MPTVYDIPANVLIDRLSEELKSKDEIAPPDWSYYVKTGVHKERAPDDSDWWYTRCAAILRKVYLEGPIGTEKLRIHFGGKKRNGSRPNKFRKGSGSIIRNVLQQLEKAGFIKTKKGEGRVVTSMGHSYLDKLSSVMKKELE
ncbi:MAG: 30S ribosomal protein S19e, partial [Candidatus Thorarchaeota archaeon]